MNDDGDYDIKKVVLKHLYIEVIWIDIQENTGSLLYYLDITSTLNASNSLHSFSFKSN